MPPESLKVRVDRLERRVEILEQLPERVSALESQIVQLRDEMRSAFSATRTLVQNGNERLAGALRKEIRESNEATTRTLREDIRAGDEETRRVLTDGLTARMTSLFDENQRHMRMLHEDLVQRISTINEGRR